MLSRPKPVEIVEHLIWRRVPTRTIGSSRGATTTASAASTRCSSASGTLGWRARAPRPTGTRGQAKIDERAAVVLTCCSLGCRDVRVDFRKAEATRDGAPLELSAREFQLLRYFLEHRGATLTRDELLNEVWGYNAMPSTRTVDVHIAWLRQKIEDNPRHPQLILTVHGLGYKFAG